MYTSVELQLLRNIVPGVQLPGIDTSAGNQLSATAFRPLGAMTTDASAPIYYNPAANLVVINRAGATLIGYDLGSASVYVKANNVAVEDCNFTATTGFWAIETQSGYGNTTISNNTFNGGGVPSQLACWVSSQGEVNITGNVFIDTPSDAVDVTGGGLISGNYFSGAGYTSNGGHPDAIWITNSTAPMSITDNFIDWTTNPDSNSGANDCVRITSDVGSVSNVTVSGNYLIGGSFGIDAGNLTRSGTYSNIAVFNNYLGFSVCQDVYPGPMTGVTMSNNVIFDYTNMSYSANAWACYQAGGLPTPNLLVSTNGANISSSSSTGPTTLYGSVKAHLFGGAYENNVVGGFGTQYIWCSTGANIFTYLSPADSTQSAKDFITNFDPAKDVIDLSAIDANVSPSVCQTFTFIGSSAFTSAGAQVRYQQNASIGTTTIQVALAGDAAADMSIVIEALVTPTAANFALTAAQSASAMANGAALALPTIAYGNNGALMRSYAYTGVRGRSFSSDTAVYSSGALVADALNLSASKGELDLMSVANVSAGSVTVTRGNGQESMTGQGSALGLVFHANETIQAGNAGTPETFAFSSGFGNETINGFALSGANADTLQLSAAAFSYLTPAMTQAQDLAAVLATATCGANATTIADSHGDSLSLMGVTAAMLAASPSVVKFV